MESKSNYVIRLDSDRSTDTSETSLEKDKVNSRYIPFHPADKFVDHNKNIL
jgi:hypothetical protein